MNASTAIRPVRTARRRSRPRRRRRARAASRTGRACRPRAPGSSTRRGGGWAARCRRHRPRDREERLVRPERAGMPCRTANVAARSGSRLATATSVPRVLAATARTSRGAIRPGPRIPQRNVVIGRGPARRRSPSPSRLRVVPRTSLLSPAQADPVGRRRETPLDIGIADVRVCHSFEERNTNPRDDRSGRDRTAQRDGPPREPERDRPRAPRSTVRCPAPSSSPRTGLTRSAIRGLIGELAVAGLVSEERAVRARARPGRPSPLVRLNPERRRRPGPRDRGRLARRRRSSGSAARCST